MASNPVYHNVPVPRSEECTYTVHFSLDGERLHIAAHSWAVTQRIIAYAKKRRAQLIEVTRKVEIRLTSYVKRPM